MMSRNNVKGSRLATILQKCVRQYLNGAYDLAKWCIEEMHQSYVENPTKYKKLQLYIVHQLKVIAARDISSTEINNVSLVNTWICKYLERYDINDLFIVIKILIESEKSEKIKLSSIKRNKSKEQFIKDFNKIFQNHQGNNKSNFEKYRKILRSYGLGLQKTSYVWKFIDDCIIMNFNNCVDLRKRLMESMKIKRKVKCWGISSALDSLIYSFYFPEMVV